MKKLLFFILPVIIVFISSCTHKTPENFVLVKGGTFINAKSNYFNRNIIIDDFYIGKYEVTQREWIDVMKNNPSQFKGSNLPVETVSWYDCIEYCNKRSIKEGLKPYYNINKNKKDPENQIDTDSLKWTITINKEANGYRLPTETEWEYAAGGGQMSKGYIYSGSNNINDVAWYWQNSGDKYLSGLWSWPELEKNHNKTKPRAGKKPNELELFDMSGNVREWCWDWQKSVESYDPQGRIWKGGGWIGADFACASNFRYAHDANGKGPDQGFRLCLNK